ncbi:hypothetical protein Hanom_Chr01g00025441 [Helianthus anomalus]
MDITTSGGSRKKISSDNVSKKKFLYWGSEIKKKIVTFPKFILPPEHQHVVRATPILKLHPPLYVTT